MFVAMQNEMALHWKAPQRRLPPDGSAASADRWSGIEDGAP
jgi:hypothetical protein